MHAVILSGGVGRRLWSISRELHPKPFMRDSDGKNFLVRHEARSNLVRDITHLGSET